MELTPLTHLMMNWSRTAAGAEQDQYTDVLPHDDVDDHTQTHTLSK